MKNEPAFPTEISVNSDRTEFLPKQTDSNDYVAPGITIRDYFAAKAISGLLTEYDTNDRLFSSNCLEEKFTDTIAKAAYSIADAMLKQRDK